MASMEMAAVCSKFPFYCKQPRFSQVIAMRQLNSLVSATNRTTSCAAAYDGWGCGFRRLSLLSGGDFRHLSWPSFAVEQGYEASIAEKKKKKDDISLTDVNVVIESRDDDKIHVRVDLTGEQTQKAFDDVLTNLARTAPPIPGFRRTKGGKTSNVPKSFLLQILGKDRVTKFLLEEIVSISIGDYVKKENLKVKSQFKTTQTAQELESAFVPGGEFSFNATMEIEKAEAETTSSSST